MQLKIVGVTPTVLLVIQFCNRYATGSSAGYRVNCDSLARGGQNGKWMHLKCLASNLKSVFPSVLGKCKRLIIVCSPLSV